jgi:hypothetical protein
VVVGDSADGRRFKYASRVWIDTGKLEATLLATEWQGQQAPAGQLLPVSDWPAP